MHTQTYVNNNILWTVLDVWSQEVVKVLEQTRESLFRIQELQLKYGHEALPCMNSIARYAEEKLRSVQIDVQFPWCKERNMFFVWLDDSWRLRQEANCNMSFWKFFFQICCRRGNTLYFYKIK